MQLVSLQMRVSVAINDIFSLKWRFLVKKGIFLTIGERLYIFLYPIISYQRINVYRVVTKDIGRLFWNNGARGKFNLNKYYSKYCTE